MEDLTGKKIRITGDTSAHAQLVGDIFTVDSSTSEGINFTTPFDNSYFAYNEDFEVIEEVNNHGLRKVEVRDNANDTEVEYVGYFHQWMNSSTEHDIETRGIIEKEDGTIVTRPYWLIKFIND